MPTRRAADRLDKLSRNLTKGVELLAFTITENIGEVLIPATPVDTGFARGNWRPSLNAPATTPITFNDPTGEATIGKIKIVAKRFRIGDTIFIRNNAEYISALNLGSSPQAAAGFVKASVNEGFDNGIAELARRGGLL